MVSGSLTKSLPPFKHSFPVSLPQSPPALFFSHCISFIFGTNFQLITKLTGKEQPVEAEVSRDSDSYTQGIIIR